MVGVIVSALGSAIIRGPTRGLPFSKLGFSLLLLCFNFYCKKVRIVVAPVYLGLVWSHFYTLDFY